MHVYVHIIQEIIASLPRKGAHACTHLQHLSLDSKYMNACVVHVQKLYMCIATDYTVHVKIKNLSMQSMPSYLNAD